MSGIRTTIPLEEVDGRMTQEQLDKAVGQFRSVLKRQAPNLDWGAVEEVLKDYEVAIAMAKMFRKRVERVSKAIIRRVRVDRTRK